MVDKILIRRKIELIQRDLVRLEEFKDKTFNEIAKDWKEFAIVKNLLMEIIGRGIDINQHILAEKFTPAVSAPLDYTETFLKLGEIGVLPENFTKEIAKSAGFRNAIVHGYNRIDKSVVFQTVGTAIEQYIDYCKYIQKFLREEMGSQKTQTSSGGFTPIEILVMLAVLIVTLAGGVVTWQRKVRSTQTPTPNLPLASTTDTPSISIESSETPTSCYTDADCPKITCAQGCPAKGPCPPCPKNRCINGKCQQVYPNYSEPLNKRIQLSLGQTVSVKDTSLSLTLLRITLSQENCYFCPVDTEVEVRSGIRSENIIFHTPGIATKEWGPHRVKEVFGFQIRLESVQPELIIISVQKL